MKNYLVVVTLLLMSLGCSQKPSEVDKIGAEDAIKGFYSALEKFDYAQMKSFCAPDFNSFENGKAVGSIDEFIAAAKPYEGMTVHISMDFVKTDVGSDMAHSIVKFNAHFKNDKMEMALKTFENYLLKKIEGKWLISFYQSTYLPNENDKKYTSIHLLRVPENLKIDQLKESVAKINEVIAKIGYPECGYSFMDIVPEKDQKYNHVMLGNWKNLDIYKTIHDDPDYKNAAKQNENNLMPYFNDQIYAKYALP